MEGGFCLFCKGGFILFCHILIQKLIAYLNYPEPVKTLKRNLNLTYIVQLTYCPNFKLFFNMYNFKPTPKAASAQSAKYTDKFHNSSTKDVLSKQVSRAYFPPRLGYKCLQVDDGLAVNKLTAIGRVYRDITSNQHDRQEWRNVVRSNRKCKVFRLGLRPQICSQICKIDYTKGGFIQPLKRRTEFSPREKYPGVCKLSSIWFIRRFCYDRT